MRSDERFVEPYLYKAVMEEEPQCGRHSDKCLAQLLHNSLPDNGLHIRACELIEAWAELSLPAAHSHQQQHPHKQAESPDLHAHGFPPSHKPRKHEGGVERGMAEGEEGSKVEQ